MFLILAALARADEYETTFGGNDDRRAYEAAANCFDVTADVLVTSIGVNISRGSSSGSADFSFVLWEDTGTGEDFERTSYASGRQSSTGWVDASVSWALEAGVTYCLGIWTGADHEVCVGDTYTDPPEWGQNRGTCFTSGDDLPSALACRPSGEPTLYLRVTVEVDDADRDGHDALADCDDDDPDVHPGADEVWYDGVDADCAGDGDYDQDSDGHDAEAYGGDDCDDTDAAVRPGASVDVWYDGVDADCAGDSDYDQDGDGDDAAEYGGGDCDDENAPRSSLETERWYDGVDTDCSGGSDYDQDGDGHETGSVGGDDCNDKDPDVWDDCPDGGGGGGGDDDDDDEGDGCLCAGGSSAFLLVPVLSLVTLGRRRRA